MAKQSPFIRLQDAERKGFDFSPWGGIDGFLEASKTGALGNVAQLKRLVPDLAHAVDMTAVAVSSLPFEIVSDGGEVIDSSAEWQNTLGGMENPQRLIYLIASSLCGGAAYVIPATTDRMIAALQYAAPHTIQPWIDQAGLQYFDRTTDQGKAERLQPEELIYFWLPDSDIEIGPALNAPLQNAMLDAQLILAMKSTLKQYGDRGFVPITLLGAKGMPGGDEKTKAESFFDRLLRGGFKERAKVVNADALSLIKVGAGMEELKQGYLEIRRDAKESIADSFGIPTALFMSDNAFASEMDVLRKQWYTASRFVGIYQTIAETFSEQLFGNYGASMRFTLESLDIFQEDEASRATSLNSWVSAVNTAPELARLGMSIMGYDLTEEQEAEFDAILSKKEQNAQDMKEQMQQAQTAKQDQNPAIPAQEAPGQTQTPPPDQTPAQPPAKALTAEEVKDLKTWHDMSRRFFSKGKGKAVDFECKALPDDMANAIRARLAEAANEAEIDKAFEIEPTQTVNDAALVLEGIRLALLNK